MLFLDENSYVIINFHHIPCEDGSVRIWNSPNIELEGGMCIMFYEQKAEFALM